MSYGKIKKRLKKQYEKTNEMTHLELSIRGLDKKTIKKDIETFMIFFYEIEMKKKTEVKLDLIFIKSQLKIINKYIKELEKK